MPPCLGDWVGETGGPIPTDMAVRGGSAVFAYYPEKSWLASSKFFRKADAMVARND